MHLPCRVPRFFDRMARSTIACRHFLWLLALVSCGCGAMHPVRGIPVQAVSDEFKAPPKTCLRPIDLSLLRQTPPREHLVDTGDVLGIYIEGILASKDEVPPVHISPCDREVAPSVGYPIPVRDDGTINLPLADPVSVRGLTFRQVEQKLRWVYTKQRPLLKTGQERILVGLQRPRAFRILVLRQEAGNGPSYQNLGANLATTTGHAEKRGVGRAISLPAYRNDVLNALAETGGLPGLDAENAVYIMRGGAGPGHSSQFGAGCPNCHVKLGKPKPNHDAVIRAQSPEGYEGQGINANAWQPNPAGDLPFGHTATNRNLRYPPSSSGRPHYRKVSQHSPLIPQPESPFGSAEAPAGDPSLTIPTFGPDSSPAPDYAQGPQPGYTMPQPPTAYAAYRSDATIDNGASVRIPLRVPAGEQPQFTERDIMLWDGDVLYVDSRDHEFFYTGGLLGGGQFNLPRDYDLDVLDAIAIAEGHYGRNFINRPTKALGGVSYLNQDITAGASQVVVIRKLANGQEMPIKVNLKHAFENPSERLTILPGDRIVLEYTHTEAVAAFIERHIFEGFLIGAATTFLYNK